MIMIGTGIIIIISHIIIIIISHIIDYDSRSHSQLCLSHLERRTERTQTEKLYIIKPRPHGEKEKENVKENCR